MGYDCRVNKKWEQVLSAYTERVRGVSCICETSSASCPLCCQQMETISPRGGVSWGQWGREAEPVRNSSLIPPGPKSHLSELFSLCWYKTQRRAGGPTGCGSLNQYDKSIITQWLVQWEHLGLIRKNKRQHEAPVLYIKFRHIRSIYINASLPYFGYCVHEGFSNVSVLSA